MKAKLLHSLHVNGEAVEFNPKRPTIVEMDEAEFKRLEAFGAVGRPTDDELKLADGVTETAKPKKAADTKTEASDDKADDQADNKGTTRNKATPPKNLDI